MVSRYSVSLNKQIFSQLLRFVTVMIMMTFLMTVTLIFTGSASWMWRTRLCPVQGREEDRVVVVRREAAWKVQKGKNKNKKVRTEVGCCRSRWRSYSARWRSCSARWRSWYLQQCRQIVDRGGREGEKKAEAEKEAKAKLLTQPSNTDLYIVQVKEKLESAKEAFENTDWAEKR